MGITTISRHNVITPPVIFSEVKSVLGVSSTSLSSLNKSSSINRWARYKPVIKNLVSTSDQLDSNNKWKSSASWWYATAQNCGITLSRFTDFYTLLTQWHNTYNDAWTQYWSYAPPTGGSSAPYRLIDFNYYMHKSELGEDSDKPLSGWMCGGQSQTITRYQMDGVYMTDGMAQLYKRSDNDYLLSLSHLSIPSGASFSSLGSLYFTVGIVYWRSSSSLDLALISTDYTFNQTVPSGAISPAGSDMRFTPTFPPNTLGSAGDYMVYPMLTKAKYNDTSSSIVHTTGMRTGEIVPLPFSPINITYQFAVASILITPTARATKASGGISLVVTYTPTQVAQGANSWDGTMVEVNIQLFKGGQSPPEEYNNYYVPAGSVSQGAKTVTYTLTGTTTANADFIIVSLSSSYSYISVGSAANVKV